MSKKSNDLPSIDERLAGSEQCDSELRELNRALIEKTNKISELEQRLKRIEKRFKSNERLANTLAECLATQVVAIDAVSDVTRRTITTDAETHEILQKAIKTYDKHKVRRWLSGFCGVFLWVASVMSAACVGAFIYWLFCK